MMLSFESRWEKFSPGLALAQTLHVLEESFGEAALEV
jgi:hypothetical protein